MRSIVVALSVGVLAIQTIACDGPTEQASPSADVPEPARLELSVEPTLGDAPLDVVLRAELIGEVDDPDLFSCPSLAWVMGNGDVLIARAQACEEGVMPRTFTSEYTYSSAGSFDAGVRLLALDVPVSDPVQVLVLGATPTPAPVAAVFGPTIVVATPAGAATDREDVLKAPSNAAPTSAPSSDETLVATAGETRAARSPEPSEPLATGTRSDVAAAAASPTTAPAATTDIPPVASASAAAVAARSTNAAERSAATDQAGTGVRPSDYSGAQEQVLPADLYFVARDTQRLWVMPASGGAPQPVTAADDSVDEYSVSVSGLAAYVNDGALRLVVPGSEPLVVAKSSSSSPVWSRDGRRLAYESNGIWLYDMVGGRRTRLEIEGRPVAFSRDGMWLLVDGPSAVAVHNVETGQDRTLPIEEFHEGGWLTDRDVVWLADPGLRLVTLRDTLMLSTLLESGGARNVFVRPDLQMLVWADGTDAWVPNVVDLAAPVLAARPFGPPNADLDSGDFSWSPDGRHGALASYEGLRLLDPATGASVPLDDTPSSDPQWVLTR